MYLTILKISWSKLCFHVIRLDCSFALATAFLELKNSSRSCSSVSSNAFVPWPIDTGMQELDQTDLLWTFLSSYESHAPSSDDMKAFHPGRIHWRRLHPTHGWTFLVMGVYVLLFNTPVRAAEGLKLVEWLLRSGASTSQKCSKAATEISLSYTLKDSKKSYLKASCASCSVLDVVRESCQQVHKKAEWKAQEDQLRKVLMVFANASSSQASPRVSIHPGIMDIWEKFYAAKGSHDLTFETADGPVTAHAQVLKEASTVLSAMLQSSMKEGGSRRVEVNDTPGSAVSLFLELLGLDTC